MFVSVKRISPAIGIVNLSAGPCGLSLAGVHGYPLTRSGIGRGGTAGGTLQDRVKFSLEGAMVDLRQAFQRIEGGLWDIPDVHRFHTSIIIIPIRACK